MHTLLVLLPMLLGVDAGTATSPGRPAAYGEARRAFARALESGALDEARDALGRRRAAAPGRLDVDYDLACVEARAGNMDRAFAVLGPIAGSGLAVDPAADSDLKPLQADPRWAQLLSRFAAARAPVSAKGAAVEIPAEIGLVEDVAEDARTGAVFVSSVRTGEIWRRAAGKWQAWARPGPPGAGAFALAVDPARGVLHVTVAGVPQTEGFRQTDEGRTALVTYRLADATELARREPPGEGPHLLGDMVIAPDETVLVSDALAGTVYRLRSGGKALEAIVPDHTFASPQTPALAADGKTLFVPDWTLGLFRLPIAGGAPEPVAGPPDLISGGIDGLLAVPGGLVAAQNGIVEPRLVRLWLAPDGRRVTRWAVLAQGPTLGDPTHVVARPGGVLAVAESGWGRFTGDGKLKPDAPPARLRLLQLDLH
jgi:hypothetical protein